MKKKFLAFGLAAAMVLGSTFGAVAETASSVEIDAGFSANTGEEKISGDFDVTYEFHNASQDTASAWFNFIVEIWGAKFGATLRADAFGWSYNESKMVDVKPAAEGEWTLTWAGQPNWDEFKVNMADADVAVNIVREGNNISLRYDITAGSATYAITGEIAAYSLPDELSMHITGEKVNLTEVTFTDNNAEEDTSEEDSSEEESTSRNSAQGGDEETSSSDEEESSSSNEEESSSKDDNKPGEDETTAPSPNGGNEEAVKATVVTAEVAKAVAEAAKITTADGKVLDVVLTATPVEDTTAVAGLIAADKALEAAKVKAFAVLDLELKVGDKKVTYLDNKVNVTIPMDKIFTDIKADETVAVYRVDKDMTFSFLGTAKVAADKTITFATDHFTQYVFAVVDNAEALKDVQIADSKVIYAEDTPDVKVADIPVKANASVDDPDQNKTGDTTPVIPLVVLAVVALGGVVAVVASKKRA